MVVDVLNQGAGKTSGDTALHVACFYGEADVVKVLVEGGADINRENEVLQSILSFFKKF